MAKPASNRKPTFLWQGCLILLPVVILAGVSFISLLRDRQAAQVEAANRAGDSVRSIGKAMRATVSNELGIYLDLQNRGVAEIRSGTYPSGKLQNDISRWETDHPGLQFAALATPDCQILGSGQPVGLPDSPAAPVPPEWFTSLSPGQSEAWNALCAAANAGSDAAQQAQQAFLATNPPSDAVRAATYLALPPDKVLASPVLATESGVTFQDIACYQLLSAKDARLTDNLVDYISREVIRAPTFLTAKLLDLAEHSQGAAAPAIQEKLLGIRQYLDGQSRARQWVDSLGQLPQPQPSTPGSHWVGNGAALAILTPATINDNPGYDVSFVPRKVVEAIFLNSLDQEKFLAPKYTEVALYVQGVTLRPFPAILAPWSWGIAEPKAGAGNAPDAIPFILNIYLDDPDSFFRDERRRMVLFELLILATACAAIFGLLAARRAFYRQLQLNEMKSNFVSSVSHELRAPIASVRLMAENLDKGKITEPARQSEYFRFIVQECRRLSSLIENVLDYSRIEQGRKEYEREPANLAALAQSTVTLMEPYAMEKGVRLEMANGSASGIEATVDGRAIQQALVNLIDNAIKHSARGQAVTVGIENGASVIDLFVSDNGPGIPRAEQEKIFERFYRLGSELRRETQGIGIGLSVVKHIAEAHGGRVTVQSEPGHGSRFTVELPAG